MLLRSLGERTGAAAVRTDDAARDAALLDAAVAAFRRSHGNEQGADIAVVIPAFNEQGGVAEVVASIPPTVCGLRTETIVVDDGSSDATADAAEAAGALVCRLGTNAGQGVALRAGYRLATLRGARFVATTDADGQLDAAELPRLLRPLVAGDADFANGSRRLGTSRNDDAVRAAGVVLFGRLVSALTGVTITDPANGLRAWRREVTDRVVLRQPQYQTSELLIRTVAAGFRVVEVPVTVAPRSAGETKKGTNLRYGARFTRVVLLTWWEERRRLRRPVPRMVPAPPAA